LVGVLNGCRRAAKTKKPARGGLRKCFGTI
jgi:hypothetical protein